MCGEVRAAWGGPGHVLRDGGSRALHTCTHAPAACLPARDRVPQGPPCHSVGTGRDKEASLGNPCFFHRGALPRLSGLLAFCCCCCFLMSIYFIFEIECDPRRVRERENPKQAHTISTEPDVGLELTIREITT